MSAIIIIAGASAGFVVGALAGLFVGGVSKSNSCISCKSKEPWIRQWKTSHGTLKQKWTGEVILILKDGGSHKCEIKDMIKTQEAAERIAEAMENIGGRF